MRAWIASSSLLLLAAAADARAATERIGLYRVEIDGVAAGETLLSFDSDGSVWIPVAALDEAGAVPPGARRLVREDAPCVLLSDLDAEVDESALLVRVRRVDARDTPDGIALVRLTVGGVDRGETVLVESGGEWWLPSDGLPREIEGRTREVEGVRSIAISSLAPPWSARQESGTLELVRAGAAVAAATPAGDGVSLVKLEVDGVVRGETVIVERNGERWIAADALALAGVSSPRRPQAIDGTRSVPLSELSAGATAFLDESAGVLRIVTGAAGHDLVALVEVVMNRDAKGEALVVHRGGETWISVESLLLLGVGGIEGQRAVIENVRYVALRSLSPGIIFRAEPGRLHLSVAPEFLRGRDQVAALELVVNEERRGEILARVGGGAILAPVETLEKAGLVGFEGRRSTIEGTPHVDLGSLAPRITHVFDEESLVLRITADPLLLASAVHRDLTPGAPRDIVYSKNTSAFVNYGLAMHGEDQLSGSVETALNVRGALASSTFSRAADGRLSRGLSAVVVDDRRRLVRWSGGDSWVDSGTLGGGAILGGVSATRVFGLDPYTPVRPTLDLAGVASTPSTVEVYVNNRLVHREQLPAGRFELENVRAETGAGNARIVVRDAFGREQTLRDPYYIAREALAPGTHEFAYAVGAVRQPAATAPLETEEWDPGTYAPEATLIARHRAGITRWLGAALRAEAAQDFASGGPAVTLGSPLGQLELAAALSRDGDLAGSALSGSWSWAGRRFGAGLSSKALSPGYATVSTRARDDRALLDTRVFGSVQMGRLGTLSVQHARTDNRDREDVVRTSANLAVQPIRRSSLFFTVARVERAGAEPVLEAYAGFALSLGGAGTFQAHHTLAATGESTAATAQRSLPSGSGFGYRVSALQTSPAAQPGAPAGADRPPPSGDGILQYQNRYGRWEAGAGVLGDEVAWRAGAAGSLIAVGGGVFASRPVQQGFALVRVPGVEGVRVYAANQEIGRTNRRGNALVPNLLSYYGNRLAISDVDIPMRYSVEATQATIAPPARGGAVVTFPVELFTAVTGRILFPGNVVPVGGELRIGAGEKALLSPVGKNGVFYFENLPAGRHVCELRWRGKTWKFYLKAPKPGKMPVTELGALVLRGATP